MTAIRQAAATYTATLAGPWIRTDDWAAVTNAWYLASQDTGVSMTMQLDILADDAGNAMRHQVVVSQAATTITVADNGPPLGLGFGPGLGHGLLVGDYVMLYDQANIAGIYAVATVVDASHYTLPAVPNQTLAAHVAEVQTGKIVSAFKTLTFTGGRSYGLLQPWAWAIRLTSTAAVTPGVARLVVGVAPTHS